jgi:hypothetical protein
MCTSDDENVIMKLSLADSSVDPDPYNEIHVNTFMSKPCAIPVPSTSPTACLTVAAQRDTVATPASYDAPIEVTQAGAAQTCLKVIRLLTEFEEKSKNGEWPSSTSVHCYWCCHRFNNAPFGLPVKYANEQFHVVGCFCSLECACAYNFASKESIDECLNRYSLINMLAFKVGLGRSIRPAPDRLALSVFGGHLPIERFRAFSGTARQIIVNSPPMLTVTQQVEEVHENDLRSEYKYIPLDNERVSRYQEKIRLKRTKPLVNFKNTLDHTMKLKYAAS